MRKRTNQKPLKLDTATVRSLTRESLDRVAGAYSAPSTYQGSEGLLCYLSALGVGC
jgi:hypothetical protein